MYESLRRFKIKLFLGGGGGGLLAYILLKKMKHHFLGQLGKDFSFPQF